MVLTACSRGGWGFPPSFKRQFSNARFIQLPKTILHHAIVLLFGRSSQRKIQSLSFSEFQGYARILGCVSRGEETGMISVLHVFTIGLKHARISAGLRKDLAEH